MKTNVEVANYLRYVADLYFAQFAIKQDTALQARGFAFAKAADNVAGGQISADGKIDGVGESVSSVIREFILTGKCSRVAGLQSNFALPDGLRGMTSLPGLTEPFLFALAFKFGVKTLEELQAALPRIQADNEKVYLRLRTALTQGESDRPNESNNRDDQLGGKSREHGSDR